jgi:peptidoglycan/xylan/chitin deacetylase (PgdA/CDA1 family)
VRYKLDSPAARSEAGYALAVHATNLHEADRLQLVSELPELLDADLPAQVPPEYRPLSWDEVRSLAAAGVEFGAHTRTHPILSAVPDAEQLRDEIAGSKARIEAELARPLEHFCYPNGRAVDIGPSAVAAVRDAGFRTAVTAEAGLNYPREDPFLLRRIGADPGLEEMYFQRSVAAFRI